MKDFEIEKYERLNQIAQSKGIVIFGGSDDTDIPLCELRQALDIEQNMYNRSFHELSIEHAIEAYDSCVAPISPETVFIHIGKYDIELLHKNPNLFDSQYLELIEHIRAENKTCRIAVVSMKNYYNDPDIAEMNRHLKFIADSEKCEYGDIATRKVWNPQATRDAASFVRNIGFVRPLKSARPIYDLIRILFCCEACA